MKDRLAARPFQVQAPLQRLEEIDQIGFLLVGEADAEALVIEVHDVQQRGRRTIAGVLYRDGALGGPVALSRRVIALSVKPFYNPRGRSSIGS